MPTFTWSPTYGVSRKNAPRVTKISFGDGYEQRVADGINTNPRAWTLTFRRLREQAESVLAFLDARGAVESFDWTPPDGAAGVFVCREWSHAVDAPDVLTISATFEEVFE